MVRLGEEYTIDKERTRKIEAADNEARKKFRTELYDIDVPLEIPLLTKRTL